MNKVHVDHRDSLLKERMSKIKNKIIVMSNKGGVGKSTIACLLAGALSRKGFKTGLLDADIHGPSVAKMTGIEGIRHEAGENDTVDPVLKGNLKIVSMGSILQDTDKALIWRGPIKITVIKQMLADFNWGELDYMIIDLPPGTGDEALSICQFIPELAGAVVVTTGQKISMLDVSKALDFLSKLNIRVLSIVENMSEFVCPHCGKPSSLFNSSSDIYSGIKGTRIVKLPFDPEIMSGMDEGGCLSFFEKKEETLNKIISLIEL